MACNTSKRRNIDENEAESGATKRARIAEDGSLAMWSRPSRSILPPERPGSIQSVAEVFQDAAQLMIEESGSLDAVLRSRAPRVDDQLLSWIPQWETLPQKVGASLLGMRSVYNASDRLVPDVHFGSVARRLRRRDVNVDLLIRRGPEHRETEHFPERSRELRNCVLLAGGIELGSITDLSTRMPDGLVSRNCLEMFGMSFTTGCEALRTTSDEVWNRLWRTLVADRDASGKPAPSRFGDAFRSIFKEVLTLRSMDTAELLKTHRDDHVSEFLTRVRNITLDRRMFRSSLNIVDENLLGLVPQGARQGDKIAILFGCSVPVVLRPDATVGNDYVRFVGEAYVHGKMDGETICGLDETAIDGLTKTFQIV